MTKRVLSVDDAEALQSAVEEALEHGDCAKGCELDDVAKRLKLPTRFLKLLKTRITEAIDSKRGVHSGCGRLAFEDVVDAHEAVDDLLNKSFSVAGRKRYGFRVE